MLQLDIEDESMLVNNEFSFVSELLEERKSCFTENYLVFNINDKMPQLTSLFMEKEEEFLDYCTTINFSKFN